MDPPSLQNKWPHPGGNSILHAAWIALSFKPNGPPRPVIFTVETLPLFKTTTRTVTPPSTARRRASAVYSGLGRERSLALTVTSFGANTFSASVEETTTARLPSSTHLYSSLGTAAISGRDGFAGFSFTSSTGDGVGAGAG